MKKTVLIVLSLLMVFTLVACSDRNTGNDNSSNNSNNPDSVQTGDNNSSEETASLKNTNEAGGDTFELVPAQPYFIFCCRSFGNVIQLPVIQENTSKGKATICV